MDMEVIPEPLNIPTKASWAGVEIVSRFTLVIDVHPLNISLQQLLARVVAFITGAVVNEVQLQNIM